MANTPTAPVKAPSASLDWEALRDFLTVAEHGSLSSAARQLGVSQPTLTRRMAALEESLRAELFRRSPRGLELTEAGEAMLGPARQMEQGAHAVELAVKRAFGRIEKHEKETGLAAVDPTRFVPSGMGRPDSP